LELLGNAVLQNTADSSVQVLDFIVPVISSVCHTCKKCTRIRSQPPSSFHSERNQISGGIPRSLRYGGSSAGVAIAPGAASPEITIPSERRHDSHIHKQTGGAIMDDDV